MKFVFLPEARTDYRRLYAFLDEKNPVAAENAMLAIDSALDRLMDNPELGKSVDSTTRQIVIRFGKGAYIMHYRLAGDTIAVTRIWHSREDRG